MAVNPDPQDLANFVSTDWEGPLTMVNLLKFADQADYGDTDEEPCTGVEAYARYGQLAAPHVMASGATILYQGDVKFMLIGEDTEAWDEVIVVKYPSRQAFIDMVSNPEYQALTIHRTAALSRAALLPSEHGESPF